MSDVYYDLYLKSIHEVEDIKKELEPQLAPLNSKINEINKNIKNIEVELKDLEKQQKSCRKKFADKNDAYKKDILAYMQDKIRSERIGKKTIVPLDEDGIIVELSKKIEISNRERDEALKEYNETMSSKKALI